MSGVRGSHFGTENEKKRRFQRFSVFVVLRFEQLPCVLRFGSTEFRGDVENILEVPVKYRYFGFVFGLRLESV